MSYKDHIHDECCKSRQDDLTGQVNLNFQFTMTKTFVISNFGHCDLPFDLAQSGELVEPFGICDLLFEIFFLKPESASGGTPETFSV